MVMVVVFFFLSLFFLLSHYATKKTEVKQSWLADRPGKSKEGGGVMTVNGELKKRERERQWALVL